MTHFFSLQQQAQANAHHKYNNEKIDLRAIVKAIKDGLSEKHRFTAKQIKALAIRLYDGEYSELERSKIKKRLSSVKMELPFIIPTGHRATNHGIKGLEQNGFIQIDIDIRTKDSLTEVKGIKQFIKALGVKLPFIAVCAESPSRGLKILIKTDLDISQDIGEYNRQYKEAQKQIIAFLSNLLTLDVALFDSTNAGKVMFLPYDESLYFNLDPQDFKVSLTSYFTEKQAQSERKGALILNNSDTEKTALEAAKYLIDNKIAIGCTYAEYFSFTCACVNVFGENGRGIAETILFNNENYALNPSSFKSQFESIVSKMLSDRDTVTTEKAGAGTIIYTAKQHGFTPTYQHQPITPLIQNIEGFYPYLVVSEKANASFVELVNSDLEACFYETSLKVTRQIKNENIIFKNDFRANAEKTLYVLYDSNITHLPEKFAGFKKTIFVVNDTTESQKLKAIPSMTSFIQDTDKAVNAFFAMLDNRTYGGIFEKEFFEIVKNKILPIRKEGGVWVRCEDTMREMETGHQCKILASDKQKMKAYLDKFTPSVLETLKTEISEVTDSILTDIKETEIQLKKEKRIEFKEFFESVDTIENFDIQAFESIPYQNLERGGKLAYRRVQTLLKANVDINTAIEAVRENYQTWRRVKGRFTTSHIIENTKSKNAKNLRKFKSEIESGNEWLSKNDIVSIAQKYLPVIASDEKKAWNEIRRMFHITSRKVQNGGNRERFYTLHFLELQVLETL